MVHNHGQSNGARGPDTVLTLTSSSKAGDKRKKPDSKDRNQQCTWCGWKGHKEVDCRNKAAGKPKKTSGGDTGVLLQVPVLVAKLPEGLAFIAMKWVTSRRTVPSVG